MPPKRHNVSPMSALLRAKTVQSLNHMQKLRNIALLALLLGASAAAAQAVPDPVQYVVYPETPGPRETVTIEVQGVGSFLGSADIRWTRDGATVLQGVGERKLSFTAGALGERTSISVTIDSDQGRFSRSWSFSPSKINLVWEANTTIPPLYKGKALYSAGSSYKVVAFPSVYSQGARVLSSALDFQWTHRGEPVPEASGRGRASFSRTGDQLQAGEVVGVEVYYGGQKAGRAELLIPVSEPSIVLYQRDALRGVIYEAALPSGISLVGPELTVQAEAYFFAREAKLAGSLPFAWTLNDENTSGPDADRGILTLRQSGSGEGSATLGVSIQNSSPDQFVQTASTLMRIVFGAQQSSVLNFLGL